MSAEDERLIDEARRVREEIREEREEEGRAEAELLGEDGEKPPEPAPAEDAID